MLQGFRQNLIEPGCVSTYFGACKLFFHRTFFSAESFILSNDQPTASRVQLPPPRTDSAAAAAALSLSLSSCAPAELRRRRHRRRCVKLRSGESVARFGSVLPRRPAASATHHIQPPPIHTNNTNTTGPLSFFPSLHSLFTVVRLKKKEGGKKRINKFKKRRESRRSAVNSLQQRPPRRRQQQRGGRTEDAEPASPLPLSVRMLGTRSPDPRRAMTASGSVRPGAGYQVVAKPPHRKKNLSFLLPPSPLASSSSSSFICCSRLSAAQLGGRAAAATAGAGAAAAV